MAQPHRSTGTEGSPVGHHPPALLAHVAAPIGRPDLIRLPCAPAPFRTFHPGSRLFGTPFLEGPVGKASLPGLDRSRELTWPPEPQSCDLITAAACGGAAASPTTGRLSDLTGRSLVATAARSRVGQRADIMAVRRTGRINQEGPPSNQLAAAIKRYTYRVGTSRMNSRVDRCHTSDVSRLPCASGTYGVNRVGDQDCNADPDDDDLQPSDHVRLHPRHGVNALNLTQSKTTRPRA